MLTKLPKPILATLTGFLFALNLIILGILVFYPLILCKILLWFTPWRQVPVTLMTKVGELWIAINNAIIALTQNIQWDIQIHGDLDYKTSYFMVSNHQSWADVLVLQKALNLKVPFMRFFVKQELIWLPILGLAWWGIDIPFMKRYSREYLQKHPEKRGTDLQKTVQSCQKFKKSPVTIINFFEGTRFSAAKQQKQQSEYRHLLTPKAGGAAFALAAMDGAITKMVDITIYYQGISHSLYDYFANNIAKIIISAQVIDLPPHFLSGDYENDPQFRSEFQQFVNQLWHKKDALLAQLNATQNPI